MLKPVHHALSAILLLVVLTALASCGNSSKSTEPEAPSSSVEQQQSAVLAQQSASAAIAFLSQTRSLAAMVGLGAVTPQEVRPLDTERAASDSVSLVYDLQGYDSSGTPIDWVTQRAQLSRLLIDFSLYIASSTDTTTFVQDIRTHSDVTGYESVTTQVVASITNTLHQDLDYRVSGNRWIWIYDGTCQANGVTWNKSGTPDYPVAGTVTYHWQYSYDYWYGANHYVGNAVMDVVITFDGSRYASVTAGAYHYTLDLETGIVS